MYGDDTEIYSENQLVILYKILPEERQQQLREVIKQLEQRGCDKEIMFVVISTAISSMLKNFSIEKIVEVMGKGEEYYKKLKGGDSGG